MRNAYEILIGSLKGRSHVRDLGVAESPVLK
jgi:hypothetical protein